VSKYTYYPTSGIGVMVLV